MVTDSANNSVTSAGAAIIVGNVDIVEGDFTYELITDSNNYVLVKAYAGSDSVVIVPSTIQNGAYIVKEIGMGAFSGNQTITEVSLPNAIEVIGKQAFMNCTNLSRMTCHD